jgi:hypothetical protein
MSWRGFVLPLWQRIVSFFSRDFWTVLRPRTPPASTSAPSAAAAAAPMRRNSPPPLPALSSTPPGRVWRNPPAPARQRRRPDRRSDRRSDADTCTIASLRTSATASSRTIELSTTPPHPIKATAATITPSYSPRRQTTSGRKRLFDFSYSKEGNLGLSKEEEEDSDTSVCSRAAACCGSST